MTLGEYIRQEREKRGISQKEMAVELGYASRSQISKKESDHIYWSLRDLEGVGRLFDMTAPDILYHWYGIVTETQL